MPVEFSTASSAQRDEQAASDPESAGVLLPPLFPHHNIDDTVKKLREDAREKASIVGEELVREFDHLCKLGGVYRQENVVSLLEVFIIS